MGCASNDFAGQAAQASAAWVRVEQLTQQRLAQQLSLPAYQAQLQALVPQLREQEKAALLHGVEAAAARDGLCGAAGRAKDALERRAPQLLKLLSVADAPLAAA